MPAKPSQLRTMCANCGMHRLGETLIESKTEIKYEGKLYEVHIPDLFAFKCTNCGTVYLDNRADDQYRRSLRNQLGLLQPEEIKSSRRRLRLKQEQLAEHLNITPESVSRWENGHVIQSRSHDLLLRAYFMVPEFRDHVTKTLSYAISVEATWVAITRVSEITLLQSDCVEATDSPAPNGHLALAA